MQLTDLAETAVALASKAHVHQPYDLIVIDEHFGKRGKYLGTEATLVLRGAGVEAFIVGLTSDVALMGEGGHFDKALAAGQDHVLSKPFTDAKAFRRLLQRLIYERREKREAAQRARQREGKKALTAWRAEYDVRAASKGKLREKQEEEKARKEVTADI